MNDTLERSSDPMGEAEELSSEVRKKDKRQKSKGNSRNSPTPTMEPSFYDPETAFTAEKKKSGLQIYYYKVLFLEEDSPRLKILSKDPVQILSLRVNGRECGWSREGGNLLPDSEACAQVRKEDSDLWIELLLLYEENTKITVSAAH